ATQSVVERNLEKQGITRQELGRERFVQEVWDWKDEYHANITSQQRRMGITCDWTRERFTLDDGLSNAVLKSFIDLYNEGLIYRGSYLVNWSPKLQTAVSDLEVEYSEEPGTLYYFKYRLSGSDEFVPVATTRPETILGDTAVAVHPEDERYRHLIGKTALVPMLDREIPIIGDAYVDREFGTGALKITPGHDPNDYEIGQRHELPIINIMHKDATLNDEAGPYAGLDRFAARKKLWADMEAAGLTIKTEPHTLRVPRSERGGEIVEPLVSTQWFMKMEPLVEPALEAVRSGEIQFVPPRFDRIYFHWLENIRDWCISRQLWWGHRIPIWYGPDGHTFAAMNEGEAHMQAEVHYGKPVALEQDPDVLDTWYSSGLWPFSTLGWPEQTEDLAKYYPTTVLETGYDIIFFWVARMIIMGLKCTGKVPFKYVYMHGLVRDETGRKMTKSLGNVLDPLDVVHEFGADALRFSLLTGGTPGNDMKLSMTRIESNRNFSNKIWNAARFVIMNLSDHQLTTAGNGCDIHYALPKAEALGMADRWILSRLTALESEVTRLIDNWQLGEAGRQLYEFLWNEYCDWYIEASKVRLNEGTAAEAEATRQVLAYVLERSLRLLHPFMPFVTESIWQNLPGMAGAENGTPRALMVSRWPLNTDRAAAAAEEGFSRIQEIVRGMRNARSEYDVAPGRWIAAQLVAGDYADVLAENKVLLISLARLDADALTIAAELPAPEKAATLSVAGVTVYLPLAGMVDLDAERTRLQKEIGELDKHLGRVSSKLENPGFINKAPAEVVERERARMEEMQTKRTQLSERLDDLAA
ncbi:MAG: valine--tRNA ligase, partial [Caldilineaceae bacterium]|nr:valine--tRNA ligase [Caldilineaceae bacterium]